MKRQTRLFLWSSACATFLTLILWSVFGERIVLYSGIHSITALAIIAIGVFGAIHFYYRTMANLIREDMHEQAGHGDHVYAPFGTLARAIDKELGNPELKYQIGFSRWRHRPSVELSTLIIGMLIGMFIVIPNLPI